MPSPAPATRRDQRYEEKGDGDRDDVTEKADRPTEQKPHHQHRDDAYDERAQ
jgi:hypothetical protein